MVGLLDVPGVHEAVEQIIAAERAEANAHAERLRTELAEIEARLADLPKLDLTAERGMDEPGRWRPPPLWRLALAISGSVVWHGVPAAGHRGRARRPAGRTADPRGEPHRRVRPVRPDGRVRAAPARATDPGHRRSLPGAAGRRGDAGGSDTCGSTVVAPPSPTRSRSRARHSTTARSCWPTRRVASRWIRACGRSAARPVWRGWRSRPGCRWFRSPSGARHLVLPWGTPHGMIRRLVWSLVHRPVVRVHFGAPVPLDDLEATRARCPDRHRSDHRRDHRRAPTAAPRRAAAAALDRSAAADQQRPDASISGFVRMAGQRSGHLRWSGTSS